PPAINWIGQTTDGCRGVTGVSAEKGLELITQSLLVLIDLLSGAEHVAQGHLATGFAGRRTKDRLKIQFASRVRAVFGICPCRRILPGGAVASQFALEILSVWSLLRRVLVLLLI